LQLVIFTDLGEDGHGLREVAHGLLRPSGFVEDVGQVIVKRSLAMAIPYGHA
jgi:hypothetical protein